MLDPQSLRVMMGTGGGLLAVGLAIWLWSVGVFRDPLVAAIALGACNLALMACGAIVVRSTRYQTAGMAITLLACLVMPLNLWFYDAQGLITIRNGGHLWVPAPVCCVIYAGVARLLRHPLFVSTFVAGIAMTGLLILADQQVDLFWEVLAPSMFLVVLGSLAVHAERLFPVSTTAFSRERFGLAFFRAGHVVMAVGLVVLLIGRLARWFDLSMLQSLPMVDPSWLVRSSVVEVDHQKMLAMLLVLGASYTYGFSQFVVGRHQARWGFAMVGTLIWSGVLLLDWLGVVPGESLLLLAVALVAITSRVCEVGILKPRPATHPWGVACGGPAAACTTLATVWGVLAIGRHLYVAPGSLRWFSLEPTFLASTMLAAASWGLAAWGLRNSDSDSGRGLSLVMVGVGCGLAAAAAAAVGLVSDTPTRLILGMLAVPLGLHALAAAASLGSWRHVADAAHASTLLAVLMSAGLLVGVSHGGAETMIAAVDLATVYGVAAASFAVGSFRTHRRFAIILQTACGAVAVWQGLVALNWAEHAPLIAASVAGCSTVLLAQLARRPEAFHAHSQTVGASAMFLSSTGGLLLTLSRLMTDESGWSLLPLAIVQTCTMIVLVVVGSTSERQAGRIYAAAHAIAGVLVVNALAGLSFWERVEIVAVTVGFVILASGHHRWLHEEDSKRDPLVDYDLLLGSLLMAGPLMIGVLWQRLGDYAPPAWLQGFHASGSLLVGLGLLAAGVTCKMRATTMVGALSLGLWLLSLFGLIDLPELETAAIQMMVGGGLLFAAAVALSVYRDRLLAIPGQVRQREGVFQVLEWR